MLIASGLTAAFVVAGLSAWRLLKAPADAMAATHAARGRARGRRCSRRCRPVVGDFHGLNTLEHQPAKIAAMEAIWHTEKGVPLVLFAIPNEKTRTNDYAIEIPYGASLILKHDAKRGAEGPGRLRRRHPPVAPVFFAFRIMVGIGVLMIAVSWFTRG